MYKTSLGLSTETIINILEANDFKIEDCVGNVIIHDLIENQQEIASKQQVINLLGKQNNQIFILYTNRVKSAKRELESTFPSPANITKRENLRQEIQLGKKILHKIVFNKCVYAIAIKSTRALALISAHVLERDNKLKTIS